MDQDGNGPSEDQTQPDDLGVRNSLIISFSTKGNQQDKIISFIRNESEQDIMT